MCLILDMFLSSFEFAGAMDESIIFRHTIGSAGSDNSGQRYIIEDNSGQHYIIEGVVTLSKISAGEKRQIAWSGNGGPAFSAARYERLARGLRVCARSPFAIF